jgi:hypothetical protein
MASRHADRQRRYRQRLSARGLVHVQGWVTPEQAEAIRRIMAGRDGESPDEEQRGRIRQGRGSGANQNPA